MKTRLVFFIFFYVSFAHSILTIMHSKEQGGGISLSIHYGCACHVPRETHTHHLPRKKKKKQYLLQTKS